MSTSFELPKLMPWRGLNVTAPPPQIKWTDWNTMALMREYAINAYALAELTGIPPLYRWGKAIWTGRPYPEIEKEYFEPLYKQLQDIGAAAPNFNLKVNIPPAPPIPADYIVDKKREPPVIINVPKDVSNILASPDDIKKKLQEMGMPTSPEDVATQVASRSMVLALTAVPGLAGMTREAARQLATAALLGFALPGTGAAATRTVQGYPNEALHAFFEVGLASTVVGDALAALKGLPALIRGGKISVDSLLNNVRGNMPRSARPETDPFVKELEDAVLRLKQGDTSKWDELVRQVEDWQKKLQEFEYLDTLRKAEALAPGQEKRYYELMSEVVQIKDKYDYLKTFVDQVRAAGIEERGRWVADYNRFTSWRTTTSDLAAAATTMPPGPVRDVYKLLSEMDYERLWRIIKNPTARANLAKRLGVDELELAQQASVFLRQKELEKLVELSPDELNKILTDADFRKMIADKLHISEDDLMNRVEDILQQRRLSATSPEPKSPSTEQPKSLETQPAPQPIESPKPDVRPPRSSPRREMQFRSPEVETEVGTRGGQVLIVKPKEESRSPAVNRLDGLPDAQTRLRMLRRRLREVDEGGRLKLRDDAAVGGGDVENAGTPGRTRDGEGQPTRTDQPARTDQPTRTDQPNRTDATDTTRVADTTNTDGSTVVTERDLVQLVPYLPPTLLSLPVAVALPAVAQIISQIVGAPVSLRLPPPPSGSMPLGMYLRTLLSRMPSMARQREIFVLI